MATPPVDARRTRRLLLVLGLACLAANLAGRALDPLVGVLAAEFATSPATIALLSTAFALPYALVQPALGPIGDSIGKRRVIRVCLLVLGGALAGAALAPDLGTLAVLRMLAGAAAGGTFPLCIAIIGDRLRLEDRQVALSRILVAGLTGAAAGALLSAALEPLIGWRGVSLLCAVAALAAAVPMRAEPGVREAGRPVNLAEALIRYRHLWSLPAARILYGSVFLEGVLIFGMFPFIAPLLAERALGGAPEAGFAVAAFAAGGFVFAAIVPALLRRGGQRATLGVGGIVAALGLTAQGLAPAAWVLILGCLLVGLGFYLMHSAIQTRVTEVAPMARGSAVAMHSFCFFLGQSLGPAAMGAGRALLGPDLALLVAAVGIAALGVRLSRRGR
jgi:MFS family permease